jgi:hypothetical protein
LAVAIELIQPENKQNSIGLNSQNRSGNRRLENLLTATGRGGYPNFGRLAIGNSAVFRSARQTIARIEKDSQKM